jgi:predicted acetylornithine/succinylornithine family transaminase
VSGPARAAVAHGGGILERGEAALVSSYARYPVELVAGRGSTVTDAEGREYLDFVAGIAVNALGHGHPRLTAALHRAVDGLLHVSNLYWTAPMVRLAERLAKATGLERSFFCNSGTEACEAAIKIVRRARPGKTRIVAFERSFHGRTLGALSVTGQPGYRTPFAPLVPDVTFLPYGDAAALAAIDDEVAGVLVEPIQGEGGVRPAPPGWLATLRARCDAVGALLVIDEVQTGIGRTGTFLACHAEGVVPDVVALAKGLGGGIPIGAVVARGDAAAALRPGDHGSTFGGGPVAVAAAHAVLDEVLAEGFLDGIRARGARLERGLRSIAERRPERVVEVRGRGLMWGLALTSPVAPVIDRLREGGLLAVPAGADVLRLLPPLIVTDAEIDRAVGDVDRALDLG